MKTFLAIVVLAALFAATATQIVATAAPRPNPLLLLALFFVVAASVAGIAVRLSARWRPRRQPRDQQRQPAPRRDERPARQPDAAHAVPADVKREDGTVKWFDRERGYGFVTRQNGDEIFVHQRSVRRQDGERPALEDGAAVSFHAVEGPRGWRAEDVVAQ